MRRLGLVLGTCASIIVLAMAAWRNYEALVEYYGAGPPYYSRTTNMDKWASPVVGLVLVDGAAIGLAAGLLRLALRRART